MRVREAGLAYEVDLKAGEKLALPDSLTDELSPGRWLITIRPLQAAVTSVRYHDAFLDSYAPEDEGLYDDYPSR